MKILPRGRFKGRERRKRAKTKLPFPGLFPHHHHPVSFNFENRKKQVKTEKQEKTAKTQMLPLQGSFPQCHLDSSIFIFQKIVKLVEPVLSLLYSSISVNVFSINSGDKMDLYKKIAI